AVGPRPDEENTLPGARALLGSPRACTRRSSAGTPPPTPRQPSVTACVQGIEQPGRQATRAPGRDTATPLPTGRRLAGPVGGCGRHAPFSGRVGEEVGHRAHEPLGLLPVQQVTRTLEPLPSGIVALSAHRSGS